MESTCVYLLKEVLTAEAVRCSAVVRQVELVVVIAFLGGSPMLAASINTMKCVAN